MLGLELGLTSGGGQFGGKVVGEMETKTTVVAAISANGGPVIGGHDRVGTELFGKQLGMECGP